MSSRRDDSPAPRPAPGLRGRNGRAGAIRPAGLVVAILTAATVFGLGMLILPPVEPEAPPIQAPPPPPVVPPTPPPSVDAAPMLPPSVDAASPPAPSVDAAPAPAPADAEAPPLPAKPKTAAAPAPTTTAPAKPKAPPSPTAAAPAKPKAPPAPDAAAPAAAKAETASPREKVADKDVAREAWRKNLPDIASEPGKAALLIPIKGSTEGATYHVTAKPRSVLITLPKGESMITMPFYNIRRDGFRQLWIKKDDATGGTTIRVVLGEASDPQVEIKDEFVRVTVRRPVEGSAAASGGAPAATPDAAAPAAAPPSARAASAPAHDQPTPATAPPTPATAPPTPAHD